MMLATVLISAVAAAAIFLLLRRKLNRDFDAALESKAAALATLVELDRGRLVMEFAEQPPAEFSRGERPAYYEAWDSTGQVLIRSPRLGVSDFIRANPSVNDPDFHDVVLPDGRPGRMVQLAVVPRVEGDPIEQSVRPPDAAADDASSRLVTLAVAADSLDVKATVARLGMMMLAASLAIVVMFILILGWVIARALRPLEALAAQIAAVDEEALGSRFYLPDAPAELAPVIARANELMSRLQRAFDRERTFSADVAHELRTPLAGLRSTLDVALSRKRESPEYEAALGSCRAITADLQRLIETLLSLTDGEPADAKEDWRYVDVETLLRTAWMPFEDRAKNKAIVASFELSPALLLLTDPDKLQVVLSNLFDNAVDYTPRDGAIVVSAATAEDGLTIRVGNSGCQLHAEEVPRVFDRFWRSDASRHNNGHAGLGLAICRRVVGMLGGQISAELNSGWLWLTISFPPAAVELADVAQLSETAE
jgi:two-component system sensor histidine kinase QseC